MAYESKLNGLDAEKGLTQTTTGVTMSPELFERVNTPRHLLLLYMTRRQTDLGQLYFAPKTPHVGDYNKKFANPTALGFVG